MYFHVEDLFSKSWGWIVETKSLSLNACLSETIAVLWVDVAKSSSSIIGMVTCSYMAMRMSKPGNLLDPYAVTKWRLLLLGQVKNCQSCGNPWKLTSANDKSQHCLNLRQDSRRQCILRWKMFQLGHLELSSRWRFLKCKTKSLMLRILAETDRQTVCASYGFVLVNLKSFWASTGWLITEHQLHHSAPSRMDRLMALWVRCGNWLGSLYARARCDSLGQTLVALAPVDRYLFSFHCVEACWDVDALLRFQLSCWILASPS